MVRIVHPLRTGMRSYLRHQLPVLDHNVIKAIRQGSVSTQGTLHAPIVGITIQKLTTMDIEPASQIDSLVFLIACVILPLTLLWLLNRSSTRRTFLWRVLHYTWITVNLALGVSLLVLTDFSDEIRQLQGDSWTVEHLLYTIILLSLPFGYAILGVVSYYQRFVEAEGSGQKRSGQNQGGTAVQA